MNPRTENDRGGVLGEKNELNISASKMAKICTLRVTRAAGDCRSTLTVNLRQKPAKDAKNTDGFTCRQSGWLFFPLPPFRYDSKRLTPRFT